MSGAGNNLAGSPPIEPGEKDKQPGIIATCMLLTVLVDIVVGLRIVVRKFIVKGLGWDDWTIIAATLLITTGSGLVIVQVHYGFGRHVRNLSNDEHRQVLKYAYFEWAQTFATLMFTKISICLFLLRIVVSTLYTRFLQLSIAALIVSNIILTVLWLVQCRPDLEDAWQDPESPQLCFSRWQLQAIIFAQAIISIVSDFVLAAMPIFILRKVQMSVRLKVGLCMLMGLGVITGVLATVRTVYNGQNINDDATWHSVWNWYWRSWEISVGIIAACIPTLRPGYIRLRDRLQNYRKVRSTGRSPSDRPSEKSTVPSHIEFVFPNPTFRPRMDRGDISTFCTAETERRQHFPMLSGEIIRTTTIDLENGRGSSSDSVASEIDNEIGRMDSKAHLTGRGILL